MATKSASKKPASPTLLTARAHQRFIVMSPRKIRRVINEIRGKSVLEAYHTLKFMPYAAAPVVLKKLIEATYNARGKYNAAPAQLFVHQISADEGPRYRRFRPRAQGRMYQRKKRTTHLTVELAVRPDSQEAAAE